MIKDKERTVLYSVEKICNVVRQKILKGQQINAIDMVEELHKTYLHIINKDSTIEKKLKQLLKDHYTEMMILSNKRYYSMIGDVLKKEIKFLDE